MHSNDALSKIWLLFEHYNIDPLVTEAPWQALAVGLMTDYIPYFRMDIFRREAGAPTKWGPGELQALLAEVENITARGFSSLEACRRLLRLKQSDARIPPCRSARTLYRRYQEAKAKLR